MGWKGCTSVVVECECDEAELGCGGSPRELRRPVALEAELGPCAEVEGEVRWPGCCSAEKDSLCACGCGCGGECFSALLPAAPLLI